LTDEAFNQTSALIRGPFELEASFTPESEEELLAVLSARIEQMLEKQPDYLLSLLYRLDVLEWKINQVMHPGAPEPPHIGLAKLVLERQKQRVETKRTIKPEPLKDWEDWSL
jgi:hypothetical protein